MLLMHAVAGSKSCRLTMVFRGDYQTPKRPLFSKIRSFAQIRSFVALGAVRSDEP